MDARRSLATILVASLALGAPLQACAETARESASTTGPASSKPMKANPVKANSSGIAVRTASTARPRPGRAIPVVLSFDGVTDPAGATLRLAADGGLALGAEAATRTLPAGETSTLTVQVVPAAEGVGYLHVFTTQYGATSVTSVPVQVGKAPSAMPASGELKQTPGRRQDPSDAGEIGCSRARFGTLRGLRIAGYNLRLCLTCAFRVF